jgi:hypothetical protein
VAAAVEELRALAAEEPGSPPEVRAALAQVVQVSPLEGELSAGEVPREEWVAIQAAARSAFAPYHDLAAQVTGAARAARERRSQLRADIAAAELEQRWYEEHLADASVEELGSFRDRMLALAGDLDDWRSEVESIGWELAAGQSSLSEVVLPVRWLASGSTRVGARDRVLTVDPEGGRFEQTQLPIDDRDRVWVAVANTTSDWDVTRIERTELEPPPGAIGGLGSRGEEGTPIPDLDLRDPEPRHRTVLRDLGRRDGNQEVAVTLTSAEELETEVRYRVRRTYHLAVQSGFALSYQPDRELVLVTDEAGALLYQDGVPVAANGGQDYQPALLVALAAYPYPTDLVDDARRPAWTRVVPHAQIGWSPTQLDRGYLGLGWSPVTGLSLSGGATGGTSQVLDRDPATYGWAIRSRFSVGWYAGVLTDVSLFRHLFQGF